ncbi:MAG: VWA domain-containing protein [Methylotenera sp.]|nr:VWA domain-containing protein [Methylotenera sp.]MDP1959453.1 VWA domain-containing protein [Methylotenera sp.]MDP3206296.1 VWA domain-containing protein [Methylotenera sp.]MDP3303420.1 VWA domain-containing protein [Methylotenera sp.]MDP3944029.1 VWA domain-containing protein [Methylotenera sp.]
MEEYVGELWHKLVTRAADKQHADAAVSLNEVSKTAAIYFRALGGDAGLNLSAAPPTRHGARRRWMQRLATSGERIELSWRDGETLRLPERIALFSERSLNRDLYLWLVALSAAKVDDNLPWIIRNQTATLVTLERFPGLLVRYQQLVEAILALRPVPADLPTQEAAQESAIRLALQQPGSIQVLPPSKMPFHPVPLWTHPTPPVSAPSKASASDGAPERDESDNSNTEKSRRKHAAERTDMPDGKDGFLMLFRAESLFSWTEYIKVNRPQDEEDDLENAAQAAEDMDSMTVARDNETSATKLRFDLDLPPAGEDEAPLGEGISLPEWDYKKQIMQPDYCRLQELVSQQTTPCELPPQLRRTANRLRSQFQALAPTRTWLKGQQEGEEIDLDAWVRQEADLLSGTHSDNRGVYRAQVNQQRDLACLLLADLSLSTDAYASDHARVIDVIRDSLFLFSEALSATGDRFAMYGFSSLKRGNVRFNRLKSFDERYDSAARGRIAAIKPGYYTRMGAAIRRATTLLAAQPQRQRLLLLLTDGKPNDVDRYEGRYGIEDTRVALHEARQQGLRPFCVTIDIEANEYLPHLFGAGGFAVIRKPEDLPKELPLLYAQMTR